MDEKINLELDVWKKRSDSLEESLNHLLDQFKGDNLPPEIPRRETIYNLLKGLKIFGKSHFNYFYHGFLNGRFNLRDKKNKKYPPAMVLRAITDQIAYDIEVITQALDQRHSYGSYDAIKDALEKADKLGQMALRPAIDCNLINPNTTVLTYFQKAYSVRVVPYANVAIIGIPFTALHLSRDFLAIPHEVAHYVFRHGTIDSRAISSKLREIFTTDNTAKYLRNWLEEIFADTYGCLVAGPVMALDFQDLQLDDPWEEFTDAAIDYEDPVPVIRPDIYTKVLGFSKNETWHSIADSLQDRWDEKRDGYLERKKGAPDITFRIDDEGIKDIKLKDIREKGRNFNRNQPLPLDEILAKLSEKIFTRIVNQTANNDQGYLEWSGNGQRLEVIKNLVDGNLEDWENLYEAFDELHDSIQKVDSPSAQQEFLMDNPNKPVVWLPDLVCNTASSEEDLDMKLAGIDINKLWIDYVKEWTIRNGHNEISDDNKGDELLNQSEPKELRKALTTDDNSLEVWGWVNLAYAEGWVTRGPEPNPVGGQD